MAASDAPSPSLGFLTVLHEPTGYLGGYLVTNTWGRPLEFRLSTAVQPNRVQQILYGGTLEPYICAELIGKTLVEKTSSPVQMVLTDSPTAMDLRLRVEMPVVWLAPRGGQPVGLGPPLCSESPARGAVFVHPRHPQDGPLVKQLLDRIADALDLAEPFDRIREAIAEARKMGVTKCA